MNRLYPVSGLVVVMRMELESLFVVVAIIPVDPAAS
jgi:hypothetical protein